MMIVAAHTYSVYYMPGTVVVTFTNIVTLLNNLMKS